MCVYVFYYDNWFMTLNIQLFKNFMCVECLQKWQFNQPVNLCYV